MALGFKIADGYVEVHANYDKGELERAAQQAADDNDHAYNKERERNAKGSESRDTNRRIGKLANEDFVRGVKEQVARQKENPFVRVDDVKRDAHMFGRVHVQEFHKSADQESNRFRSKFRALGAKISKMIEPGTTDGAGKAASAFVRRFLEIVSFGQADVGGGGLVTGMAARFATIGTAVGGFFAAAFVARAAQAITALLPLALAGIGALGIFAQLRMFGLKKEDGKWIINLADKMGRALKRLKDEFKDFIQFATDPLYKPIIRTIRAITDGLNTLRVPLARFMTAIGKGLTPLAKGAMEGITAFFKALEPAGPGITAGLKQWGKELPRIFKALGEMFTKILKDPEKVKSSIKATSDLIIGLLGLLGDVIVKLTDLAIQYDNLGKRIDTNPKTGKPTEGGKDSFAAIADMAMHNPLVTALDNWSDKVKAKLMAFGRWIVHGGLAQALQQFATKVKGVWAGIRDGINQMSQPIIDGLNRATTAVKNFVTKVIGFVGALPGKIWAALKTTWAEVSTAWNRSVSQIIATVKAKWTQFIAWLKTLPGKGAGALISFPSRIMGPINTAIARAAQGARDLVTKVIAFLKTLPGKARSAVSSLWSSMSGAFTKAATSAKAKATDLVNRVVAFFKTLPGKARSAVSSLWSSMSGAFSTAVSRAKTAATNLVNGFINTLKGIVAKAKAQITAAKNAIVNAFSGAGSWLVSAGRSIMTGLANGIRSGASAAISAAGAAARSALAAAKRALGIKSPSKAFAEEVGKPAAQGIALGLQKHFPIEMDGLSGLVPAMAGGGGGSSGVSKSYSSTFSPNVVVHISEGLNPMNAAARRALIKDIFLELEQYKKDYVNR